MFDKIYHKCIDFELKCFRKSDKETIKNVAQPLYVSLSCFKINTWTYHIK